MMARSSERPFDLLIQGGTVIDPSNQVNATADVAIRDGRVVQVGANLTQPAARIYDASDRIVCPGMIDAQICH